MCGIAGYNVSERWAENIIKSPEMQKKVLQEAWLHNLHRGSDAAGYFALKADGNYKVYKKDSDAATLLTKNLKHSEIPITTVFGAHTRAMTKGDAKVKANNHPVYYGGIFVTHNGSIRNDVEIKKTVPEDKQKQVAEVDSVAIPIRLSAVETPLDVSGVTEALSELLGGYAFHAVWRKFPGISVLAKGDNSPLMLATHPYGGVFYASEVEALWAMIGAMNLDPKEEEWQYYSVKDHGVIIIQDGVPVAWADYEDKGSDEIVSRVLPKGKNGELNVVYTSKGKYDFAQKNGEIGRDLRKANHIEELYSLEEGAAKPRDGFPRTSDTDMFAVLSEADRIVKNTVSGNNHVFFGDVEIIMSGRVIQDVYDHSKFKMEQRWFVDPKIETPLDSFDDFLLAKATKVLQTPDPDVKYRYDRSNVLPLGGNQAGMNRGGRRNLSSKTSGLELIHPNPRLNWNNIWNIVTDHEDLQKGKDGFVFMSNNLACTIHEGVRMHEHPDPEQCGYAKASAAYTLSCAPDLEILTGLVPSAKIVEKTAKKPCTMGKHDIVGTVYFEVILASNRYFEILIEEECMDCGTVWEVDDLPFWLLNIVGGKKELLVHNGTE